MSIDKLEQVIDDLLHRKWTDCRMKLILRSARFALSASLVVATLLMGLLGTGGSASADTRRGSLGVAALFMGDTPSDQERISYSSFLGALRNAAGHLEGDSGMRTQSRGPEGQPNGLIQLDLHTPNDQGGRNWVSIWVNPSDLYVWGFTNQAGQTWSFSESTSILNAAMGEVPTLGNTNQIPPGTQTAQSLGYESNYQSLANVAGRSISDIQTGFYDLRASIQLLATVSNPTGSQYRQEVARSLQTIIQATAEAARLNDVEGIWRSAMTGYTQQRTGLAANELETHWSALSSFLYAHLDGATYNYTLQNVGTLRTTADARRYLAMSLGSTSLHPDGSSPQA
jgi:hypothetical protein